MSTDTVGRWWEQLDEEDLAFVKRFILASGSLKEVASVYGVSYPTVRRRLDQVIAKVRVLDASAGQSRFETTLRLLAAEGRVDSAALKLLMAAYREENT